MYIKPSPILINPSAKDWETAAEMLRPSEKVCLANKLHVKLKIDKNVDTKLFHLFDIECNENVKKPDEVEGCVNYSCIKYCDNNYTAPDCEECMVASAQNYAKYQSATLKFEAVLAMRYVVRDKRGNEYVVSGGGDGSQISMCEDQTMGRERSYNVAFARAYLRMMLELNVQYLHKMGKNEPTGNDPIGQQMNLQANHSR